MARNNPHRRRPFRRGTHRRPDAPRAARPSAAASPAAQRTPSPPAPTDERITRLLTEISELRLSAATHLTVAAAAMDAGRADIATELIEAQQRDVARLRSRAEELLGVEGSVAEEARRSVAHAAVLEESALLETAMTPATKSLRRSPRSSSVAVLPPRSQPSRSPRWSATGALLAVAAAVVVALLRPLAPPPAAQPDPDTVSASVVASLDANVSHSYTELQVTAKPKAPRTDVDEASARLHADLQRLLPLAASDPQAARRVLQVLASERALLADKAPAALSAFGPEAGRIVTQLRALANPMVLAILPEVNQIGSQPAASSDALRAARDPQPSPGKAPAGNGSGSGSSSQGSTGTANAPTAPVVGQPDPPHNPIPIPIPLPQPTAGGGGGGGGGNSSGSGGSAAAGGTATPPVQVPAPQLPAPLVVGNTQTNLPTRPN
ncbi:MAG TPA: hypothetical protein VLR26_05155 [Frankiaceae bacterium]|nr:hypothetical protein [Frankiaceae bacterium]